MKELLIEEKAKRYDEALTKARNIVNSINVGLIGKDSFEEVFPELKESEDERIRKEIIAVFKGQIAFTTEEDGKKYIAWLEKQSEQNPAVIIPKFKVGDTMRTLQEAADGIKDGLPVVVSIDDEYYRCNNEIISIVEQEYYEYPPINKKHHAWSEDDEKEFEQLLNILHANGYESFDIWLKSLKDRYTWKPSDEQMLAINTAINVLGKGTLNGKQLIELQEQLKRLKEE